MSEPKGRSERAPPAPGPCQLTRNKGCTRAQPDPQAWKPVTTVAERATQIINIMDWYVQDDLCDGRHMQQEWIIIHPHELHYGCNCITTIQFWSDDAGECNTYTMHTKAN